jgi:hypothetical protein
MGQIINKRTVQGCLAIDRSILTNTQLDSNQKLLYALLCESNWIDKPLEFKYLSLAKKIGYKANYKNNAEDQTRKWIKQNLLYLHDYSFIYIAKYDDINIKLIIL